jgi:VanZ family protein
MGVNTEPSVARLTAAILSPALLRSLMAFLAVCSTLFVVYASLVPLKYVAMPWEKAVTIFQASPWLALGIERRADWVANGLIMVPAGFFACGAVDWQRRSRLPLLLLSPLIVVVLVAIVIGIEFVQVWFPPRVVSQNDMFAGILGSIGGVLLWWSTGRLLVREVVNFFSAPPGIRRWMAFMHFGMLGLLLYSLMPLDAIFSVDELQEKVQQGKLQWSPFPEFNGGPKEMLLLTLVSLRLAPWVFLLRLCYGLRTSIQLGLLAAIFLEVIKLPIYSRSTSLANILAGMIGGVAVALLAPRVMSVLHRLDRAACWLLATVGWSFILGIGFLGRFKQVLRDPETIRARFEGIWTVPFARAHSSSEFEAGENILLKVVVFAVLSFLLSGVASRLRGVPGKAFMWLAFAWCLAIGIAVEVGQVFLEPLVPDVTDFLIYAAGSALGIVAFPMMLDQPGDLECPLRLPVTDQAVSGRSR